MSFGLSVVYVVVGAESTELSNQLASVFFSLFQKAPEEAQGNSLRHLCQCGAETQLYLCFEWNV